MGDRVIKKGAGCLAVLGQPLVLGAGYALGAGGRPEAGASVLPEQNAVPAPRSEKQLSAVWQVRDADALAWLAYSRPVGAGSGKFDGAQGVVFWKQYIQAQTRLAKMAYRLCHDKVRCMENCQTYWHAYRLAMLEAWLRAEKAWPVLR